MELDPSFDASLFVSLAGRGIGVGCISVNPTFGKRPASAASAHQQELRFVSLEPITNCCHMNTFACGFPGQLGWPPQCKGVAAIGFSGCHRHRYSLVSCRNLRNSLTK